MGNEILRIENFRKRFGQTEVLRVIRSLKDDGRTMIVVTHEMGFARAAADKVIYMADGVIEEEGPPEAVFGNPQSEKTKNFLRMEEL